MAQLTGEITINETVLAEIDGDPRLSGGLDLPVSTLAIDNVNNNIYFKKTISPTGWINLNSYSDLTDKPGTIFGQYYLLNNSTPTTISSQNTFQKILGTTSPNSANQNFSHSNNRLTYTGLSSRFFKVTANAVINPVETNVISIATRIAKNNVTSVESESEVILYAVDENNPLNNQAIISLATNDFVEVWVSNKTNTNSVVCKELNLIIEALN
jgi:hypothetical protein